MKKLIISIAMTMVAMTMMAQFSINWSTIDGGGGVMTGDDYALRGTIGQTDAENMAGGDFEMYGGFWVPVTIQVEGAPWLYIEAIGSTNVMVYWHPAETGWMLQETDNLKTNWIDAASGSTNPVVIPAVNAAMFYRLRQD